MKIFFYKMAYNVVFSLGLKDVKIDFFVIYNTYLLKIYFFVKLLIYSIFILKNKG